MLTLRDGLPPVTETADQLREVAATISAGTGDQVVPVPSSLQVAPSGAQASVTVRCGAGGSCKGTLQLTARTGSGHRVVIGATPYRIGAGHRDRVRIRIAQRYRAAVRHHRLHGYAVRAVHRH